MRKIYKCKFCKQQTSIYDSINAANSPLLSCPKCGNLSDNTAIEGWVESISFRSFDEDIEESCKNGTINLLFDRDFNSGIGECLYHCRPTCHPAQIDENDWKYGCKHPAWPANQVRDFVPIVSCGGAYNKCEVPEKFISSQVGGKTRSINHLERKIKEKRKELSELMELRSIKKLSKEGKL